MAKRATTHLASRLRKPVGVTPVYCRNTVLKYWLELKPTLNAISVTG
ncbi:uncharacterized protein METZ01_LOCUS199932, partial [marine metagenome]